MSDKRNADFDTLFTELLRPRIAFPVTKEELELIQKQATERGVTVEQYVYEITMKAARENDLLQK